MKEKSCDYCGYVGTPVHDEYSSVLMDISAWVFSFAIAAITGIIPLILLGPIFSIWHIVTFRSHRCPKCGNWTMHAVHNRKPLLREPPPAQR